MTRLTLAKQALPYAVVIVAILVAVVIVARGRVYPRITRDKPPSTQPRTLSHEEALRWIDDHKAWRLARKTRAIWARPVRPEEVGREFQTADQIKEVAKEGSWLCVGVADEPWFQSRAKIDAKYEAADEVRRAFAFDEGSHAYRVFKPRGDVRNWVAQIKAPDVAGFYVRPGYDPSRPLYSPSGGYVVKDEVEDPYHDKPADVWLVQQSLFESTYELIR